MVLLLSACAELYPPTTPATPVTIAGYWHKEGVSKEDAATYREKCYYQVGMNSKITEERERRMIQACMQGAGFRWIPPRTVYR